MSPDLSYYDLEGAPLVRVYTNLLPDVEKILEILKESEKSPQAYKRLSGWQQWNDLGTMVPGGGLPGFSLEDAKLGKDVYFKKNKWDAEIDALFDIHASYFLSLDHYSSSHPSIKNIKTFPDGPAFYKYDHTLPAPTPNTPEFNMNYHTDFPFSLKDNPGKKGVTTCTIYLNDDYYGGEMVFNLEPRLSRPYYKRSEQFSDNEPFLSGRVVYRPKAGDVVVFPSGNPDYLSDDGFYFHSVNRVTGGDKYFCSIFNSYEFEGSEDWKDGVEEYGLDLWLWLEKKRAYNAGFKNKSVSLEDEDGKYLDRMRKI